MSEKKGNDSITEENLISEHSSYLHSENEEYGVQ